MTSGHQRLAHDPTAGLWPPCLCPPPLWRGGGGAGVSADHSRTIKPMLDTTTSQGSTYLAILICMQLPFLPEVRHVHQAALKRQHKLKDSTQQSVRAAWTQCWFSVSGAGNSCLTFWAVRSDHLRALVGIVRFCGGCARGRRSGSLGEVGILEAGNDVVQRIAGWAEASKDWDPRIVQGRRMPRTRTMISELETEACLQGGGGVMKAE